MIILLYLVKTKFDTYSGYIQSLLYLSSCLVSKSCVVAFTSFPNEITASTSVSPHPGIIKWQLVTIITYVKLILQQYLSKSTYYSVFCSICFVRWDRSTYMGPDVLLLFYFFYFTQFIYTWYIRQIDLISRITIITANANTV